MEISLCDLVSEAATAAYLDAADHRRRGVAVKCFRQMFSADGRTDTTDGHIDVQDVRLVTLRDTGWILRAWCEGCADAATMAPTALSPASWRFRRR
jgi:hypothetical protein